LGKADLLFDFGDKVSLDMVNGHNTSWIVMCRWMTVMYWAIPDMIQVSPLVLL
jgi:hypothetical protein